MPEGKAIDCTTEYTERLTEDTEQTGEWKAGGWEAGGKRQDKREQKSEIRGQKSKDNHRVHRVVHGGRSWEMAPPPLNPLLQKEGRLFFFHCPENKSFAFFARGERLRALAVRILNNQIFLLLPSVSVI